MYWDWFEEAGREHFGVVILVILVAGGAASFGLYWIGQLTR
jgi:hypothetical protein